MSIAADHKSQKHWKLKADTVLSEIFNGKRCAVCWWMFKIDNARDTKGHHLIEKSICAFHRHTPMNIMMLCPDHHTGSDDIAPHSTNPEAQEAFRDFIEDYLPHTHEWIEENKKCTAENGYKPDYEAAYHHLVEIRESLKL